MKKSMNQLVAVALMISLLFTFGCEKEKKDSSSPELPPLSSFLIDVGDFTATKTSETHFNFAMAITSVYYWNSMLTVGLAVPVAAYVEALKQTPVRIDNDTWEWTYDIEVHGLPYSAVLTANVTGDIVNWEMRISQEENFQDFLWFSGTSNILRTSGSWSLYNNPTDNEELLSIDWNHDWGNNTFDVTYTVVTPGGQYNGSYIEYGITEDPIFDVYYDIYDSAQDYAVTINYNTTTHEGNITQGDTQYCWDSNFVDIECP